MSASPLSQKNKPEITLPEEQTPRAPHVLDRQQYDFLKLIGGERLTHHLGTCGYGKG